MIWQSIANRCYFSLVWKSWIMRDVHCGFLMLFCISCVARIKDMTERAKIWIHRISILYFNSVYGRVCPLVMHYWVDLELVQSFRCYDNVAPNAKSQQVLVFTLCLVDCSHSVCSTCPATITNNNCMFNCCVTRSIPSWLVCLQKHC